ncbi:neurabin-1-like isoform X2 [Haliotis cracherodii]|uniref:neurabin-1-like isoform X2 n=1 Tax=Haliotis cracherodii TaxID=6455 RepID=UPI0039E85FFE
MAATGAVTSSSDRKDVLEASRTRSGSLKRENIENQPPEDLSKTEFEEGGNQLRGFRSKVSKMKEMFQASMSGDKASSKPEIKLTKPHSAPSSTSNSWQRDTKPTPLGDLDKSPEIKRKRVSDVISPTSKSAEISPSDNLLEATNHVQRFNYTRNMFARMEQENKIAQERERNIRIRRPSPNRLGRSHTPPTLSPVSTSPSSPERHKTMSPERHKPLSPEPRKSFDYDPMGRTSSSSSTTELDSKILNLDNSISKQKLCGSLEMLKGDSLRDSDSLSSIHGSSNSGPSFQPDITDAQVSSTVSQSYHKPPPSYSSSTRGALWLKRYETRDNANIPDRDRTSQLNGENDKKKSWLEDREERKDRSNSDPERTSVTGWTRPSRSHFRSKHGSDVSDYAAQSSCKAESYDQDSSLSNSHSSANEQNDSEAPAVMMRAKKEDSVSKSNRLSKEDIQKAIEKADSYLQNRDDEPSGKRRSWDLNQRRDDFSRGKRQSWDVDKQQEDVREVRVRSSSLNEDSSRDQTSSLDENTGDGSSSSVPEAVISNAFVHLSNSGSSLNDSEPELTRSSSSISSSSRPTPIPRRSAPPPPDKPPNATLNSKRPIIPPPPAPKPKSPEDFMAENTETIVQSTTSTVSSSVEQHLPTPDWDRRSDSTDDLDEATGEVEFVSPEDHIYVNQTSEHNILEDADSLLLKREQGDGHEDPDSNVIDVGSEGEAYTDEGEQEVVYFEMPGLSSTDEDSSEDEVDFKMASKIKFSRDPIRVFFTYSTDDYDRRNEDVDPVAASAEYELEKRVEKMDVFPVELQKGSEGLGLSIIGMGVGADAGLEKLGIFIKTLTEGGAAQRDSRIQVNDQIIEVDGKSLVGVTQAYAANVLRNTQGTVKFLIGREKDPSKSEVARLIQQSLEQDKRREDLRRQELERRANEERIRKEEERMRLKEELVPRDEVLEHELKDHDQMEPQQSHMSESEKGIVEDQEKATSLDMVEGAPAAGEATPMSMPSGMDSDMSSPEDDLEKPTVEVFELPDSSSDSMSPEMKIDALFIKLKESHYKNAVADAELAKLRAKIILLDKAETQRKQLEKKNEELTQKLKEGEKSHENTRKELAHYQDLMEGSQGQYIMLEKKMKADFTALEKKYHKAKKLIKDYQLREKDFIQERESLIQQQSEKDQQYNALVKSLKDRIFQLEKDLIQARQAAGLPVDLSTDTSKDNEESEVVKAITTSNGLDIINDMEKSPTKSESAQDLGSVPSTPLLDTSAHRAKAQLASGMGARRPPTKRSKSSESDQDTNDTDSLRHDGSESGLETWIKHDSDSTVRKSDAKKRRAFQPIEAIPSPPLPRSAPPPPISSQVAPPVNESDNNSEQSSWSRRGSHSDNSSSVSQTSYDPSQPNFRNMDAEIPDFSGESQSGENTHMPAKGSGSKGFGFPKFSLRPKSLGGGSSSTSGVVLLSSRPRDSPATSDEGGITLISKKNIDTGLYDYDGGSSTTSEISSSLMVSELDDEGKSSRFNISGTPATGEMVAPNKRNQNQFESVHPLDWTSEHVCRWLILLELDKYNDAFQDRNISGPQLLQMDGSKLKSLGITNGKDRELLKKKIKELKAAIEKEKKQQEKERKAREKEQKKQMKKK